MRFQGALLRLLLLVLCLNTTVGMALHSGEHFGTHQTATPVSLTADVTDPAGSGESGEPGDSDGGSCDYCRAYAALGLFLDAPCALALPLQVGAAPSRVIALGFVPNPENWRFAARDPPRASA
eukprot:Opistho-1_new@31155